MVSADSSLNEAARSVWDDMVANSETINAKNVDDRFDDYRSTYMVQYTAE